MFNRSKILALIIFFGGCATMKPVMLHRAFQEDTGEAKKLVETGHLKQGVDDLSMLLDMDPKNSEARFLRAKAYQGLEQFDLAVKDYEALLKFDPNNTKALYNLGMIFGFKLNEPERALELLSEI